VIAAKKARHVMLGMIVVKKEKQSTLASAAPKNADERYGAITTARKNAGFGKTENFRKTQ
jgi:hypothetical protein